MSKKRLLIFFAGQNELEAFCNQQLPNAQTIDHWTYYNYQTNIDLVHCGIGSLNAVACAECIIPKLQASHCLNIGFSGSHDQNLEIGQILISQSIVAFDFHTKTVQKTLETRSQEIQKGGMTYCQTYFQIDSDFSKQLQQYLLPSFDLQQAVVGSSNQFNRNPDFINQVRETFGTDCEDMESAAIAYSAFRYNIPFVALRIISNNELQDKGKTIQGKGFDPKAFKILSLLGRVLTQLKL